MGRINRLIALLLELAAIAGPLFCLSSMPIESARWVIAFALAVSLSVALLRGSTHLKRTAESNWLRTLGIRGDSDNSS